MKKTERYITGTGQRLTVHTKDDCVGEYCPIHKPYPDHTKDWPTHWRGDKGIMERIDPLGVGHPDMADHSVRTESSMGIHGCNGLCHEATFNDWLKDNQNFYDDWLETVTSHEK